MVYVALLRGINVGGKNKIDMKLLNPAEFGLLIRKIAPIETAAQLLMIGTLVLMVVKPF